jgi:transcriptional regulator GlxA family with amidase domain
MVGTVVKSSREARGAEVERGGLYTSAAVRVGMDLALAEEDHGRDVALEVARELVLFVRRPGRQSRRARSGSLTGSSSQAAPGRIGPSEAGGAR